MADDWVRFHMLPESKRYPENPAEWTEVLRRHHALLASLMASTADEDLTVSLTSYQSIDPEFDLDPDPDPEEEPWSSYVGQVTKWAVYEPDDSELTVRHLWLWPLPAREWRQLDWLLTAVADDRVRDVLIGPRSWRWLYHPYDGGADVVAETSVREALSDRHRDWLSPFPGGL